MKNRTVNIVKKLTAISYPLSVNQLAIDFNVSPRTIYSSISEANEYFSSKGFPQIQTFRKKGVILQLSREQRVAVIKSLFLKEGYLDREERIFDLLLSLAFSQEPLFLNRKEEEYRVSKSTLDEDMRRLRNRVFKYGVEIVSVGKQGTILKGAERSIRTMLFDVINQTIGLIHLDQTKDVKGGMTQTILYRHLAWRDIQKIVTLLRQTFPDLDDDLYENQLLLFSVIWLYRLQKEEIISAIDSNHYELADTKTVRFVRELAEFFQLEALPLEMSYLQFILDTLNPKVKGNTLEWVNAQLLTIQLIQFVEAQTKILFTKKEEILWESLYTHMAAMITRLRSGVQVLNPITENIKRNYKQIYEAVNLFIPTIEEVIGEKVPDDEVAFLVIHFSTVATSISQEMKFIFKSVVICNHGVATGNLLAANLKLKYPHIDVSAVLSSHDLPLVKKLDIDLIFSTYPIDYLEKPVLVIDPFITAASSHAIKHFLLENEQYKRIEVNIDTSTLFFNQIIEIIEESGGVVNELIYQMLVQKFENNQFELNTREMQPMLKDKLPNNNVLIQKNVTTWEEAIEVVAKPLLKENIIEKSYIDAMIHSVKKYGPYIVIGEHVALAHARPEDGVNKLGISVATLAPPIEFGSADLDPVKIIFCLSAVDAYSHLNIMKELIHLIHDGGRLDRLIAAKAKKEFKQILFEEID